MSWQPTASNEVLRFRSNVVWEIRSFFRQLDFVEVHTPTLSRDTVVDRHIDPIEVNGKQFDAADATFYLQTSPEFAMKRLVASGMSAIYQIGPAFRADERGRYHNPEFTMVEWYRVGDDFLAAVELLSRLCSTLLPNQKPVIESYRSAFMRKTGLDPLAASVLELNGLSEKLGVDANWSEDKDDWLNLIFSELVQPSLGRQAPTIITHYPASQSALAQIAPEDASVAERFELFIDGVELANGYHELLDSDVLVHRSVQVNAQRRNDGKPELPVHSRLSEAMEAGLPACGGCALGLERLIMAMLGKQRIDEVLAFPVEIA